MKLIYYNTKHLDEMLAADHKMWLKNTEKPGRGITRKEIQDAINKDNYVCKLLVDETDKIIGFVLFRTEKKKYNINYLCCCTDESCAFIIERIITKLDTAKRCQIEFLVHEKLIKLQQSLSLCKLKAKVQRQAFGEYDGYLFVYDIGENYE